MIKYDYEVLLPYQVFESKDEILNLYGSDFSMIVKNCLIIKDRTLFNKYKNSLQNIDDSSLLDFVRIDGLFMYLIDNWKNSLGNVITIRLFENDAFVDAMSITRSHMVAALKRIASSVEDYVVGMRLAYLSSLASFDKCRDQYMDKVFIVDINGTRHFVKCSDLFDIMNMSYDEMNMIINGDDKKYFLEKLKIFMFVAFMRQERILEKYLLTKEQFDFYKSIEAEVNATNWDFKQDELVDVLSICERVELDDKFFKTILAGCMRKFSRLEKTIYIYERLCYYLSIDSDILEETRDNFQNPNFYGDKIRNITTDNNKVSRQEFIVIFVKLLEYIGVSCYINPQALYGKVSDDESVICSIDKAVIKFLVNEDDCELAKKGECPRGVGGEFFDERTLDEIIYKIHTYIVERDHQNKLFNEAIKMYHSFDLKNYQTVRDRMFVVLKMLSNKRIMHVENIQKVREAFERILSDRDARLIFLKTDDNVFRALDYNPITLVGLNKDVDYNWFLSDNSQEIPIRRINEEELLRDSKYVFNQEILSSLENRNGKRRKYVK